MRSSRPKLLHTLLGEALVSYPLLALKKAGIKDFIVVLGHETQAVQQAITHLHFLADCHVEFVTQKEQLGTGHAVLQALPKLKEATDVIIVNGDSPHLNAEILQALILEQQRTHELAILAANLACPTGYGRLRCEGNIVSEIIEERDADEKTRAITLVNAGVYATTAQLLREKLPALTAHHAQGEFYLTDLVKLAKGATCVGAPEAHVVLGVNSQAELWRSAHLLGEQIITVWHQAGVSIEASNVVIGPHVTLEPGAIIERGATLLGNTHIESEAHIEHHVHLHNVRVEKKAHIRAFTYAEDCHIGSKASVGPMARIRARSVIGNEAEVGNFCEIKNTILKSKAKSHHVSYLGDAEIGERTNIGAGTIICNYDGYNKPHSHIADDVFVGSNSTLVAPVNIGARAYVAAGSTITDPVPADALALGRAHQVVKENYAPTLKSKLKKKKEL